MAGHHSAPAADLESGAADSHNSSPRSDHYHLHDDSGTTAFQPRVRFMCSFGGKIVPRPHDNQLRYVGGDTRIVAVHRHTTFGSLLSKLSKLSGTINISIKYQLPNEDLDALITVTGDEDVENMMEEYDRLSSNHKLSRLRLFLFPTDKIDSRASSITSLLDGSAKRENWFLDALNGGASDPTLERGRSEVSSIVSEVPDYLFGLDNTEDSLTESNKIKGKEPGNDTISVSDTGSPSPQVTSLFYSPVAPPELPVISSSLPQVKTRPDNPIKPTVYIETERIVEKPVSQPSGYSRGPIYHYPNPPIQPVSAPYYLSTRNVPVQQLPVQSEFVQPYPVVMGQVQVGYPGQPIYYGTRNVAMVPGSYPGTIVSNREGNPGYEGDTVPGRVYPGP